MKKLIIAIALFTMTAANAALLELNNAQEFKDLISHAHVPVVVQFSAYWCGPCQDLKATLKQVAPSYTDDQVLIAYVDAYVNSSLQSYLQGGYPTVRTFMNGSLGNASFVGSRSASYVRSFIDSLLSSGKAEFCPL